MKHLNMICLSTYHQCLIFLLSITTSYIELTAQHSITVHISNNKRLMYIYVHCLNENISSLDKTENTASLIKAENAMDSNIEFT
jgi:putative lipase involved disintegration of autophagic bodies